MIVCIMRHAEALPGSAGIPDAARPLTLAGVTQARNAAGGLQRLGYQPAQILTSPLLRAGQTADAAAEVLGGVEVAITAPLAPNASPAGITELLRPLPKMAQI